MEVGTNDHNPTGEADPRWYTATGFLLPNATVLGTWGPGLEGKALHSFKETEIPATKEQSRRLKSC